MRLSRLLVLALGLLAAQPALAQLSLGEPVSTAGPVLTLEKNRLYADSRFGRQTQARIDADLKTLAAENRNLEAALEAEEAALAERRSSLPAAEFQTLAAAFDARVRDIRQARDAKVRDLSMRQDQAQQAFLDEVGPVLDQILTEMGAELIIDRASVILASPSIDITDLAIRRIDETLLPTGTVAEPDAGPAPAGSGQD
jgi:Skp family chaperone for outer membrane proteins